MENLNLAIIEDDSIVRESLVSYFEIKERIFSITAYNSVEAFIFSIQSGNSANPDIILLDIQLPGKSGIEGIPEIRTLLPECEIIMLTTFEDSEKIFSALCAGACSYLSKQSSLSQIYECVVTVSNGGSFMSPAIARKITRFFVKEKSIENPLSQRQMEIVHGIVDGLSYKMIGSRLNISLDTVRTHIMQIYRTLNINCKGQLIKWVHDNNI
jgi:DNA-binding NarL/FixJ family response regulator